MVSECSVKAAVSVRQCSQQTVSCSAACTRNFNSSPFSHNHFSCATSFVRCLPSVFCCCRHMYLSSVRRLVKKSLGYTCAFQRITGPGIRQHKSLFPCLPVPQGVVCSLRQLLEEGFFHADPHPGNLVVTADGQLAYFDFGMMSQLSPQQRFGLIRAVSGRSSLPHGFCLSG